MSYSYRAYGLSIRSDLPIPEFIPAEPHPDPDIEIRLVSNYPKLSFQWSPDEVILPVSAVALFRAQAGRTVTVYPAPAVEAGLLRLYLIGLVMGILLYQRGRLVLHAGAVLIEGEAVAFVGRSGQGKSSLVAALHRQGCPVIADDVLPVNLAGDRPLVSAGYPHLKLDDVIANLLQYPRGQPLPSPQEKWIYGAEAGFEQKPTPLGRLYFLTEGNAPRIEPLPAQEKFLELVRHSYPTRFGQPGGQTHLEQCVALARQTPILRLHRGPSSARLPDLAAMIIEREEQERAS